MNHPFAQLQDFFCPCVQLGAGGCALRLRVICWRCSMIAGRYMCLVLSTPRAPILYSAGSGSLKVPIMLSVRDAFGAISPLWDKGEERKTNEMEKRCIKL